jgi:hypothetical protein
MLFGWFVDTFRIGYELVSELYSVVGLDGFDFKGSCFYEFFKEVFGVIN